MAFALTSLFFKSFRWRFIVNFGSVKGLKSFVLQGFLKAVVWEFCRRFESLETASSISGDGYGVRYVCRRLMP